MHEVTITQSLLDIVLKEAAKAGASKVVRVSLVLGEMSGVAERSIQSNFDLLSRNTPAEGAELSFRNVPKQARCVKCGHLFHPEDICWECPACQSVEFEIIAGNELYVESIEVE
jgi:hydrogenase nickel incorporation protein HypA/HybF